MADLGTDRGNAVRTYLGIAVDIAVDYNSRQAVGIQAAGASLTHLDATI